MFVFCELVFEAICFDNAMFKLSSYEEGLVLFLFD